MGETDGNARKSLTLEGLARILGVSRTTVSNAFNRPDQLSAQLRDKVLTAAQEMGYPGPNPMARMLRTGRTGAIGLVFSEPLPYAFDDATAIALLQGVAQVCERVAASLLILPAVDNDAAENTVRNAAVDGFILYCLPTESPVVSQVLERRLPVVAVDQPNLTGVPSVGIDDRLAACQAATHLTELGHRRLAIISLGLHPDGYAGPVDARRRAQITFKGTALRLIGYEDAMRAARLDPLAVPVEECSSNSEDAAYQAAMVLLKRDPRPTGILAMSDRLAIGALRAAEQFDLTVPQDLSVIGFDDIPLAARVRPSLTTIHQPLVEKGVVAAELLLGETKRAHANLLSTRLIV
jgi:DNA-binding LacI/PurR family transcriptional regulator